MIIKNFQIGKLDISKYKFFLFYGKNEGLKNEIIQKYFIKDSTSEVIKYDENELINNRDFLIEEMLNQSLFSNEKVLIISRASEKMLKVIEELLERNPSDIKIIIKTSILDKKSKLRNFFEKNKNLVVIPFYDDEKRSLLSIVSNFLTKNDIKLSRESINLLVDRARGTRENLYFELDKIFNYAITNKSIDYDVVKKLTNIGENYSVNELADNFLSKNKKNISKILNENNFSDEDCILIIRTILSKSKRLKNIIESYQENKNLDEVIGTIKPPIFWKDKENVKDQVKSWKLVDLKNKIYQINEIEKLVKSNTKNSLNIVSDFIVNYQ